MAEIVDVDALAATPHAEVFDTPRTIRLRLEAGESIAPHSHPGLSVVAYVIDGHVSLTLDDAVHPLEAGHAAHFSGERRITPTAETDATVLLVFVPTDSTG
ncbi:MAG: cupin domain-containing protein [Halobacteriota archaeon]